MEECELRKLPKDILVKLISDIQDPNKMSDEYIYKYLGEISDSFYERKICKLKPLLKAFFNHDIFDKLQKIEKRENAYKLFFKNGEYAILYYNTYLFIYQIDYSKIFTQKENFWESIQKRNSILFIRTILDYLKKKNKVEDFYNIFGTVIKNCKFEIPY